MPVTTPVKVDFGEHENEELDRFVDDSLTSLMNSLNVLHTTDLPKWRRLYKGIPLEKERNWPWPGASNVVIQLIAENVDIIKARIIGTIWEILPLWPVSLVGDWSPEDKGEEQRAAIESFMGLMAMEPGELDLLRVESLACNDMVQLGTVVIKSPWETEIEQLVIAPNSTGRGEPSVKEITKYDGPRPEKLEYENWGATETAPTIEKADFKYHHYVLHKQDIEMRIFDGRFDEEAGKKILESPDRLGQDNPVQEKLETKDIKAETGYKHLAEWDIYECWFWKWHGNKKYKIIYQYHKTTKTRLKAIFNFYPVNDEPWDLGRLGYTDDGLRGYGLAEMLEYYQDDVTTGFNQRADNRTLANTSVVLGGRNPKIDANMGLYPGCVLPLDATEASIVQMGREYTGGVEETRLTRELAAARCGVDPPTSGSGGGTVNKKGGYSAMGTFSVMQSANRRVNINITDFRYLHLKLGRRFGRNYAEFGIGERLRKFGKQAEFLQMALKNIKEGRMEFPIRAATASINKELEKQNDMLLSQVMLRHQQAVGALMQGLANPAIPDILRDYAIGSIAAMAQLMGSILRNFGHDDLSRLQPELEIIEKIRSQRRGINQGANQSPTGSPSNAGPESIPGEFNQEQTGGPSNTGSPQLQIPGAVLPNMAGSGNGRTNL